MSDYSRVAILVEDLRLAVSYSLGPITRNQLTWLGTHNPSVTWDP